MKSNPKECITGEQKKRYRRYFSLVLVLVLILSSVLVPLSRSTSAATFLSFRRNGEAIYNGIDFQFHFFLFFLLLLSI